MKTCKLLTMVAVAFVLAAGPALAQPGGDAAQGRRLALARRYYAAIHFSDTMDAMMKAIIPVMSAQEAQRFPNLSDDQRKLIADTTVQVMHDLTPQLLEKALPSVATVFSEEELTQMVAFYESPVGQSVVTKSPQLAAQMGPLMRDMLPAIQSEMTTRLCAKLNCPASAPASKPAA